MHSIHHLRALSGANMQLLSSTIFFYSIQIQSSKIFYFFFPLKTPLNMVVRYYFSNPKKIKIFKSVYCGLRPSYGANISLEQITFFFSWKKIQSQGKFQKILKKFPKKVLQIPKNTIVRYYFSNPKFFIFLKVVLLPSETFIQSDYLISLVNYFFSEQKKFRVQKFYKKIS